MKITDWPIRYGAKVPLQDLQESQIRNMLAHSRERVTIMDDGFHHFLIEQFEGELRRRNLPIGRQYEINDLINQRGNYVPA